DYFKESLAKMEESHPGAPTIDNVIEKLERQQREAILKKIESANYELDSSREDIFEAFGGQRDTPYSEEELNTFATESDVTRSRLNKRWIIRKGDNCYLFMGGEYGSPVSVGELVDAAKIDLAAAVSSGVDFYRYNKKEEKIMKSEKDLLRDYSTLARHIHVDLAAQKSKYNWKTKTLIEAPCPLRLTTPEFNPEVDQYLRLLGGQYAEQLLDWVSLVTKLDEPCAALFLHGASGAGKSLLTLGLSRLWTVGTPTQIRDVLSNFNDALVGSPLVVADEKIHSSNNKEVGSAELRNLIQEYSRPLRRKFQANSTLMGALRVIITANNTNVLGWKENLNGSDIKAIQDRILSIHVGSESANFLRALSHQQRCDFVDKDVIAKHALWLRDTRVHKGNVRFLVEGCDQSFHYSLVTNNGINSAVLHWLVGYLQDPQKLDSKGVYQVRIYDGRLLVNVQALVEHWDLYKTNTDKNVAVAHRISMTLSNLSESTKKQLPNGIGTNTSYWKIQTDYLLNWSRDTGYASDEEILAALAKNSVLPGHKKAKAFV
ncbi:MAG: primase-helicase family protein, partial [Myxococcaceae bacterium]